jgi:hypothetical protein
MRNCQLALTGNFSFDRFHWFAYGILLFLSETPTPRATEIPVVTENADEPGKFHF